jgi:hypothetical protein
MKENWIIKEARKHDESEDSVILENPGIRKHLDDLLLKRFWPVIKEILDDSMYNYSPQDNPETEFELSHVLSRSLTYLLLDGDRVFFKGNLTCSTEHWMLGSEFFLSLPLAADPRVVFEILGNSRFSGNPPTLSIDKRYGVYEIILQSGNGAGWGLYGENHLDDKIREAIDTNIDMYELVMDEDLTVEKLGEFLTMAYKVYEAF